MILMSILPEPMWLLRFSTYNLGLNFLNRTTIVKVFCLSFFFSLVYNKYGIALTHSSVSFLASKK